MKNTQYYPPNLYKIKHPFIVGIPATDGLTERKVYKPFDYHQQIIHFLPNKEWGDDFR